MKKNILLLFLFTFSVVATGICQTTIIPYGASWKYLDNGTNQGTAWKNVGFSDSGWKSGAAQLGYGDGDEATVVGYGSNANSKFITTYFRTTFNVSNPASFSGYTINVRRDDGIVVYINGTEVFRDNMPAGTISYTTLSSTNCADDGGSIETKTLTPAGSAIVSGANTIAVEIHQTGGTSSDISFDLQLTAAVPVSIPRPDHVLIVVMENHSYNEIIGNSAAPFINSLSTGSSSANFTKSFALTHPSQPNYLLLFSGANQGVTTDNAPTFPFTTPNLGAQLIAKGFTFKAYAEDLPSSGYTGASSGKYVRRHCPWVYWQGAASNGIPAASNLPFTSFPQGNFTALPTVSFVIPNLNNDIHDGTVAQGDTWVKNNLSAYITWASSHNSLFILTFDEDDNSEGNQITTMFVGPMVKKGQYANTINHYNVLRTLEDMYGLPYAGSAASASPVTNCWTTSPARLGDLAETETVSNVQVVPNPVSNSALVNITLPADDEIELYIVDVLGKRVAEVYKGAAVSGTHQYEFNAGNYSEGNYLLVLKGNHVNQYLTFIKN